MGPRHFCETKYSKGWAGAGWRLMYDSYVSAFLGGFPIFLAHVVVGALLCTGTCIGCLRCLSTFHRSRDCLTTSSFPLLLSLPSINMYNQRGVNHRRLASRNAASVASCRRHSYSDKKHMVSIVNTMSAQRESVLLMLLLQ